MTVFGISGWRGNGKTALAKYLAKEYGFEVLSFAEPLREKAKLLMPFADQDLSNPKKKESKFRQYDWTPRDFMINLGEFMRFHDKSYWLNQGLSKCSKKDGLYAFDDVRYLNEADAIRAIGGKIIRVNRYEAQNPYGKRLMIESETQLDNYKFDYVVEDCVNTTLSSLHDQGDAIVEMLG